MSPCGRQVDFSPGLSCACLQVFPCLIAGGLQLVQLCPDLILLVLQGIDGFIVFDLRFGLGLVSPCLEQIDLRVPFIQLSIELLFVRFSFVPRSNLLRQFVVVTVAS